MKTDILLKNLANIFKNHTDQIANTKGNISKITIKEKYDNLYNDIKNFIEKDSIDQQVRQTHTSFFISGLNINTLEDAQSAANSTISSYSNEIITDENTQKDGNDCTNFITKVQEINTKKKHKLFRVETIKKKHVKIVKEQQQLSAGQALIRNSRNNSNLHIEREIPRIFKKDYFILKKQENLMHAAIKHENENTILKDDFRSLQTRIVYDSDCTKMRLKHREVFLCEYSPWVYTDVDDIYPSKNYEN